MYFRLQEVRQYEAALFWQMTNINAFSIDISLDLAIPLNFYLLTKWI
jgi:hypothetical protein